MIACPPPYPLPDSILLAHGEGARLTRRLVREVLLAAFDNEFLRPLADAAVLRPIDGRVVMSTDSYVVNPLSFPGGDIGCLAVHGTINDLAVTGAEPLCLSVALIIEEGLPMATFARVVGSIRDAARGCGVPVVTGDTKVVPRGAADQLFVNTTGLGRLNPAVDLGAHRVRSGDRILVSGTLGDHGIAVLSARGNLELESDLRSDTAPLYELVRALADAGVAVHFLRDPTRGGVSAVLHELADAAAVQIVVEETALPIAAPVRGACELLGLDPLYVANEGKLLLVVPPAAVAAALACLRAHPLGRAAAVIGTVGATGTPEVLVRGMLGRLRVLDEPSGAPLPRIC